MLNLGLLASAVAGRPVSLAPTEREAHTDGRTIFVPELSPEWVEPTVLVQAALIGANSFPSEVMKRISGHRKLPARYLCLEVARAADVLSEVLPRRVSALITQAVPGPLPASAEESLRWAQDRGRPVTAPPVWFGELRPGKVRRAGGVSPGDGGPPRRAGPSEVLPEGCEIDAGEAEHSRVLELFQMPGRSPLSSVIQKMLGLGGAAAPDGPGGGATSGGHHRGDGVGGNGAGEVPVSLPALSAVPLHTAFGRRYPEWDERRGTLRADWCTVLDFDPPTEEPDDLPTVADDRALRRQLAALGFSSTHHPRQSEGDLLDLNAMVDFIAERAGGEVPDARIYAQARRTGRDLAVLVLLDATASSSDVVAGRRQFDEHRLIVDRLAGTLESLGNPVSAFGFASSGREAVRFLRIKDFRDRYDRAARHRLARVQPQGFTRLGAAIRHATHLLERDAGSPRRLLVMVGDGFPFESDYEGSYAEADSRRALAEAIARGIGCVRVSVDAGTCEDPCVERIWGDLPQRRLDRADALALHVRPLFAQAIRSATASKRSIGKPVAAVPRRMQGKGVRA